MCVGSVILLSVSQKSTSKSASSCERVRCVAELVRFGLAGFRRRPKRNRRPRVFFFFLLCGRSSFWEDLVAVGGGADVSDESDIRRVFIWKVDGGGRRWFVKIISHCRKIQEYINAVRHSLLGTNPRLVYYSEEKPRTPMFSREKNHRRVSLFLPPSTNRWTRSTVYRWRNTANSGAMTHSHVTKS